MGDLARRAIEGDEPMAALVEDFYGPEGPLLRAGWVARPQQRDMSMAIARALDGDVDPDGGAWLVCEAPTGTGKGLAYLVPGILAALRAEGAHAAEVDAARAADRVPPREPRKLIVSTSNIALQDQLVNKDIPAISEMLEHDVRVTLMKSKRNYACRQKIRNLGADAFGDDAIGKIVDEVRNPDARGDREDFEFEIPNDAWARVSSSSEDCLGRACKHYALLGEAEIDGAPRACCWRRAILGYQRSHVIVANHAFLTMNGGIRSCLLAVDEMHEFERALRGSAEQQLSPGAGKALAARMARLLDGGEDEANARIAGPANAIVDVLTTACERANRRPDGSTSQYPAPFLLGPGWLARIAGTKLATEMLAGVDTFDSAVDDARRAAEKLGCHHLGDGRMVPPSANAENAEEAARAARVVEAGFRVARRLRATATGEPHEDWPGSPWAMWAELETRGRGTNKSTMAVARMSPADVSWATGALRANYPIAMLTSATVPEFRSLRLTLGMGLGTNESEGQSLLRSGSDLDDDDDPATAEPIATVPAPRLEKRLPSPYPLPTMGLMVVPPGPTPKEQGWEDWATNKVVEAVVAARGRTLVLCSSLRAMHRYAEALRGTATAINAPWSVRKQGEMGRSQLRKWFAEDVDGVLVASRSFFQGLDVRGQACSCVVIDRVPFGRPDDPVENAVGSLLEERARAVGGRGSSYDLRSVPEAAMALAQASGRLIRSETDRGVVVVLDPRILRPSWKPLRAALPPFPVFSDIEDVRRFLDGEPVGGRPSGTGPVRGRVGGTGFTF